MDNINQNINTQNLISKILSPMTFYSIIGIIIFLIIMMFFMIYNVNILSPGKMSKSQEEITGQVFIILFFSLIIVGICITVLPNMSEFRALFEQISNVTYVILYTIFAILFYTMMPENILNNYSYLINPAILGLGAFSFYKGSSDNYVEKFNITYERVKMLILLFCLITFVITFYNVNPGNAAGKYFGYSLLLTIILSVFAFLYIIILTTLPGDEVSQKPNLLSNFTSFGSYGSILFILFLVVITTIISYKKDSFFSNKAKGGGIIMVLLVICILWSLLLSANLFSTTGAADLGKINLFKKSLLMLFGLVISGLLIFWITYNVENLSGSSSITSFILNLLLIIMILGLIYKTVFVKLPTGNAKKNAFFNLISNTILYIPCLVGGVFDKIGKATAGPYNAEDTGSFMMLIVSIILLLAYFKLPSLLNYLSLQGGKQLVNKPVYTDKEYNLGNYIDLNGTDQFDYQFAISCWIYIDSAPPNTNQSYTKFTSLLNFGNKPNILYNAKDNTLMITMQQRDLENITKNQILEFDDNGNRIIYVNKNFLLQKWNNIIVNYNGGTLDIFLNGELVKSSIEVVPYYTIDNLTIGQDEGIKGGICNVIYFRNALSSYNIYYLYNLVKNKTPPVLNESNATILKKDVNLAVNSTSATIN